VRLGRNVIAAFIAYICALEGNPDARNLRGMRSQIASKANYDRALEIMQQNEGFYGVLQQLGTRCNGSGQGIASVRSVSTIHQHLDSPLISACTSTTSFDLWRYGPVA